MLIRNFLKMRHVAGSRILNNEAQKCILHVKNTLIGNVYYIYVTRRFSTENRDSQISYHWRNQSTFTFACHDMAFLAIH